MWERTVNAFTEGTKSTSPTLRALRTSTKKTHLLLYIF